MNPIVKKKFVAALESGEYKFGKGAMYNFVADTHCPLGVLAEIALEEGIIDASDVMRQGDYARIEGSSLVFPGNGKIVKWAELSVAELRAITNKNDNTGTDHAIKYIKENL